jgi:IS30 family transposase
LAERRAERLAFRPKVAKLAANRRLHDLVQRKLLKRLSPEQVAAALRRELAACLRTGRALRPTGHNSSPIPCSNGDAVAARKKM